MAENVKCLLESLNLCSVHISTETCDLQSGWEIGFQVMFHLTARGFRLSNQYCFTNQCLCLGVVFLLIGHLPGELA